MNSEQKPSDQPKAPVRSQEPLVRRFSISDYGAAAIGEGIAFAGLCVGLGICGAEFMWGLVIIWAFQFGPSKSLLDKPTANTEMSGQRNAGTLHDLLGSKSKGE